MIDESKRKKLIYASIAFISIVILLLVGFVVFFNKNDDLPPIEADNTAAESVTPEPVSEEVATVKNGITFEKFDELSRFAITDNRIDVIQYYLAQYANTQSTGAITTFTVDSSSVKESKEGERNIVILKTKDNANTSYTVELSYTFSADADVRILDSDNNVLQTSPTE